MGPLVSGTSRSCEGKIKICQGINTRPVLESAVFLQWAP